MRDVVFILLIVAFFAVAAAYVKACGRIIGPDDVAPGGADDVEPLDGIEVRTGGR